MWLSTLEALAVHDAGAGLVVLLLGDPHLLEGGEGGEDGAADPDGVLALRRGDDLDLHGRRGQRGREARLAPGMQADCGVMRVGIGVSTRHPVLCGRGACRASAYRGDTRLCIVCEITYHRREKDRAPCAETRDWLTAVNP